MLRFQLLLAKIINQEQEAVSLPVLILEVLPFWRSIKTLLHDALSHHRKKDLDFALLRRALLHDALCHHGEKVLDFALLRRALLHDALSHHGFGDLHEASHIGALYVVYIAVGLCAVLHAVFVDVLHDPKQLLVHLFGTPAEAL